MNQLEGRGQHKTRGIRFCGSGIWISVGRSSQEVDMESQCRRKRNERPRGNGTRTRVAALERDRLGRVAVLAERGERSEAVVDRDALQWVARFGS
jgi:hypothetical protein